MTRSEQVLEAVRLEVGRQRNQIDAANDLRRAELVIIFDERTGEPFEVLFRTEARRRVPRPHQSANGTLAASR